MKMQSGCDFESVVVKAVKSGFVGEEIKAHVKSCADCREAAKIAHFFQINLTNEPPGKNLPVAGFVWWKHKLHEKNRAAEQVTQPILIVQIAAVIIFIGLLVWLLNNDSLYFSFLESGFSQMFTSIEPLAVPYVVGVTCFAFVCLTLIYTLRRLLREE